GRHDVADQSGDSGVGIHLEITDVATVGEGRDRRREMRLLVETGLDVLRKTGRERGCRHLLDADPAVGAGDRENALVEFNISLGCLELVGRYFAALLDDLARGEADRGTADGEGARAAGAAPEAHDIAVALEDADALEGESEFFRHELGIGRLMPLAR